MRSNKKIKVAILGLGTVGGGTLQLLQENEKLIEEKTGYTIKVSKAVVLNKKKKRDNLQLHDIVLYSNIDSILDDRSIDVIFEATGDNDITLRVIQASYKKIFSKRKKIITANKALLAEKWLVLAKELACTNFVRFEATVGGAIPVIDALQNGLSANEISSVYGIINGTCNFILSKMERGDVDFQTVLQEAQELGYAEPDPSLDVGGQDTAHKLIIMMNLVYRSIFEFSKLHIEGIDKLESSSFLYAKKMGYKIKLLAISKKIDDKIQASVHPTLVPNNHILANTRGVDNAIFLEGNFAGNSILHGVGAGARHTASAMVSDMIQMLSNDSKKKSQKSFQKDHILPMEDACFEYFVEFELEDKVKGLESIRSIFSKNSVEIKKKVTDSDKKQVKNFSGHLAILTNLVKEKNMLSAISLLKKEKFVIKNPNFIRVLPSQK